MARLYLREFTETKLKVTERRKIQDSRFKTTRLFSLSLILCLASCLLCLSFASYLHCDTTADGSPPVTDAGMEIETVSISRPAIVDSVKPIYLPKTTKFFLK